jgi:hypothetical protein
MAKPTNYDELYPGRFLKAGLFKGQKVTLTIRDGGVDIEPMEDNTGKPKQKTILSFVERPMEMIICKTNGLCIKAMFGKELKDWYGKRVTFFQGQWNGEECIRVWGSPDIEKQFDVSIELPRRKPFPMTMHKVGDKKEPTSAAPSVDPRIETAWGILGLTKEQAAEDMAAFSGTPAQYLSHLNTRIDDQNQA